MQLHIELFRRQQVHEPHEREDLLERDVRVVRVLDDVRRLLPGVEELVALGVFELVLDVVIRAAHRQHAADERHVIDHEVDCDEVLAQQPRERRNRARVEDDDARMVILERLEHVGFREAVIKPLVRRAQHEVLLVELLLRQRAEQAGMRILRIRRLRGVRWDIVDADA